MSTHFDEYYAERLDLAQVCATGQLDEFLAIVEAFGKYTTDTRAPERRHYDKLRHAAGERLARERGWRLSANGFEPGRLRAGRRVKLAEVRYGDVLDHCEYFSWNRQPVAILSHTYKAWTRCEAFAAQHGLTVERLPYSWYFPGRSLAALFTRGVA